MVNPKPTGTQYQNLQEALLKKLENQRFAQEWLIMLLEKVSDYYESSSPIPAINEAFDVYARNAVKRDDEFIRHLTSLMNLATFISELSTTFEIFDRETDYINLSSDLLEK